MKTNTASKLLGFLEKRGKTSPKKLSALLRISPQAIHRQLRKLENRGLIVSRGSPPMTQYMLAGRPDFEEAFVWLRSEGPPRQESSPWLSETRDVLAARLPRLKEFVNEGLS